VGLPTDRLADADGVEATERRRDLAYPGSG
jgi:hypothetical protein